MSGKAGTNRTPLIIAGILLGIGLGGFVDGIVLHQILQWHHILTSAGYPATSLGNLEVNTLADGLFHAGTWLLVVIGLTWAWRTLRSPGNGATGRDVLAGLAAGWGLFNLVEGVVNHHILKIHRVNPGGAQPLAFDLAFLALGVLLVAAGWWLHRTRQAS